MEADLMLTAVLIGFGFGNTFLCTLVALNTTIGRSGRVCMAFLGGRMIGVMALGVVIALYGWYMEPDARMMILIFALLSLAFGALVMFHPTWLTRLKFLKNCEVNGCGSCDDDHREASRSSRSENRSQSKGEVPSQVRDHACDTCTHSGSCPSSEGSSSRETSGSSRLPQVTDRDRGGFHFPSVFLLGSVRGATPCVKIMMLVPLILTVPFHDAMALVVIYALSSSIYTVAGILVGSSIGSAAYSEWKPHLTRAGAMMMMVIGVYYLYKYWTYGCSGGL